MSDARTEVEERLARTSRQLEGTLAVRESLERAIKEAQDALHERHKDLEAVLKDEGNLRKTIGELERMVQAFDDAEGVDANE